MVRADFITSIVLMVFGLAWVAESWRMPRYTDVGSEVWSAPGVVPGMLGLALILLASILGVRSGAVLRAGAAGGTSAEPGGWGRVALAVGLCVLYAAVLVGNLPFWLATFLFVLAFVLVFELLQPGARAHWLRHGLVALAVAAVTGAVVPYVFQTIFLVRLP